MSKFFLYICILLILANCSNKTTHSGKIIKKDNLNNVNFLNKDKLLSQLGTPSYIDPIENKYFYFLEKGEKKSIFKKEKNYSYVFVFKLDLNDMIIDTKVYDTKNVRNIEYIKD